MATPKKLPSGAWRIQIYVGKDENGKAIRESITADTKREVEELARKREDQIRHGIMLDKRSGNVTVGEAIDNYIDARDAILSPKTILEYRNMRRSYCQDIMPVEVGKLTENMVQKSINKLAKTHSAKTCRNFMGLFTPAVKAIDRTIDFRINLPQKEHKEMSIPDEEQLQALLDAAKETPIYVPVLLAATAGLRRSEIAALDYDKDIDYTNNTVTINKAVVLDSERSWTTKQTKTTSSNRKVKIPAWVADEIKKASEQGIRPANANVITDTFGDICKKLDIKNIRFHDLRHYYASTLLALGVPDKYAMARMGHSTTNMLKNVYQHRMKDKDKEFDETIENHFNGMKPEN